MKKLVMLAFVSLSLFPKPGSSGEVTTPVWESSYTKTPPVIDGNVDVIWEKAKPLAVVIREAIGGDKPVQLVLRAIHTDDTFYVIAQWPDDTKDDMRDPYVWNADRKDYDRPSKPDDQFALEFPMAGEFDVRMLTLKHEYTADVWHWKAGRGNPVGFVDDKVHVISQKPASGGAEYSMGGHGKVYISRMPDEGTSSYFSKPKPAAFAGKSVDSFEHRQPTGSLADVLGKGVHDGKMWTLEMSRKFNTGHNDDVVIDPNRDNICAVAVLNDELYWEHSVSPMIILRFIREKTLDEQRLWSFNDETVGKPPTEFSTGKGNLGRWEIIEDKTAPSPPYAVAQTSNENSGGHFNLAVIENTDYADLELEVKFKAVSGTEDQGGGPIWRYRDPDNYYVARANPLENNFRVYKVTNGSRKQLATADLKVTSGEWHTIKITNKGNEIKCYYNGKLYLEAEDSAFRKGKIGLWTKADAVTAFDDINVREILP